MGLLGPSCLTSGGPRLLYLGFEASLQAAFALESPELILLPTKYLQRCGSAALLAVSPAPNALCAYFRVGSHPQEEGKKRTTKQKKTNTETQLSIFLSIYIRAAQAAAADPLHQLFVGQFWDHLQRNKTSSSVLCSHRKYFF